MKKFDIDSAEPKRILADIARGKELSDFITDKSFAMSSRRHHFMSKENPGVENESMLDWRKLEKRTHELHVMQATFTNFYWDSLKKIFEEAKKNGAEAVWLIEPGNHNRVTIFDGDSTSTRDVKELIDAHVPNPNKRAHTVTGEDAKKLIRANKRSHTFRRRWAVYHNAFMYAIEERINPFVKETLLHETRKFRYYDEATFVISNEGRKYVLSIDHEGRFRWSESNKVYIT